MITLRLSGWKPFFAIRDKKVDLRFMRAAADESEKVFRAGMRGGHSGRKYPNLPRRSSAPGEYPANQFGPLMASINSDVSATRMEIGTGVFYAIFLREGTRKMARRKMSDTALQEGLPKARSTLKGWVKWGR